MTSSPVLTKISLEPHTPAIQDPTQAPLVDLHAFMITHALFVAETYRLLPEIYELVWQALYKLQSQDQMARQLRPTAHNGRRRGPPSPDPEPAAPPYVLLPRHHQPVICRSKKSRVHATTTPPPAFSPRPFTTNALTNRPITASSSFPNPDLHVCPAFRYQTALIRVPSPNSLRHLARM